MIKQLKDQIKSNIQIYYVAQNQLCTMVKHNRKNVEKCKCNLLTYRASKSSLGTCSKVTVRSRLNWDFKMLVFVKGGK